jgi:hypothetical protein
MRTNGFYWSEILSASVDGGPIVTKGKKPVEVVPHERGPYKLASRIYFNLASNNLLD